MNMQIMVPYRLMFLASLSAAAGFASLPTAITAKAAATIMASHRNVAHVSARISERQDRRAIPNSFLGFSVEYGNIPNFFGRRAPLQAIARLTRRLTRDNGPPVFRIGGNSEDRAVWGHISARLRHQGDAITLSSVTANYLHTLVQATDSRLILGLNLGRGSAAMAIPWIQEAQHTIGSRNIIAFEIGNEPDLYNRHGVRPHSYTLQDYLQQVRRFSRRIRPLLSRRQMLAGPAFTGPWRRFTPEFIAQQGTGLAVITMHEYPLGAPVINPKSPKFGSIGNLLKPTSVTVFASLIRSTVRAGHKRHIPVRFAEINSAYMGGKPGVSNAFVQSLWSLDILFTLASIHCDGVNFHTGPVYGAFWPRQKGVRVLPLYYGMWVFARATKGQAHLTPVLFHAHINLKIWATLSRNGRRRIVIINKSLLRGAMVNLLLPKNAGPNAVAELRRLMAPSAGAANGITFGGQTFTGSRDGRPMGARQSVPLEILHRHIRVLMPASSAALIDIH